jgi:integrase
MGCIRKSDQGRWRVDFREALRWSDIDLQAGKIFVRRSLSWARLKSETGPARPRFYEPKTKSGIRTLPAPPELLSALRVWKLECPKGELDLVFAAPTGLPAHRSNVLRYGLYRALRRAGLRRVDMHSLRHSFASALIMAGAPLRRSNTSLDTQARRPRSRFTAIGLRTHKATRLIASRGHWPEILDTFWTLWTVPEDRPRSRRALKYLISRRNCWRPLRDSNPRPQD